MTAFPVQSRLTTASDSVWFPGAMGLLLVLCWMLGGVTTDSTSADEILQLSALPLFGWAVWRVVAVSPDRISRLALMLMFAVIALPLWQLLPLPQAIGMGGVTRHAIAADLALAGVPMAHAHASLSTFSTERALWSLLPALSLCLAALTLTRAVALRLLQLVLALVLASAAFAFFQLSLPDGSPLLLYTSWGRNFGGVFVNPNHQGNALTLGAVIAAALFIDGRRRASDGGSRRHWLHAFLCAACVIMVPLAKGTAAMLLVMVGLVVVTILVVRSDGSSARDSRGKQARVTAGIGITVAMLVVLSSALAWRQKEQDRRLFATTTVHIGQQFSPLGTGVGSFVPVFAQYQNLEREPSQIVNHAHNEYVQWWLEGGVPALLVMAFGLGAFGWSGWQVLTRMPSRRWLAIAASAWTGLLVLLLHSLVDYPLRTITLMATAGLFAGLLFNSVNMSRQEQRGRQHRDAATQRA